MLRVALDRPRDAATTVRYVLAVDGDPVTPDADAADHDGMDGEVTIAAGATEADIGIAIRDDTDIEPPRESFTVTLQATEARMQDFGLGIATVRRGRGAGPGATTVPPGSVRNSVSGPFWPDLIGPAMSRPCNSSGRPCRPESADADCGSAPNWGRERFPRAVDGCDPRNQ